MPPPFNIWNLPTALYQVPPPLILKYWFILCSQIQAKQILIWICQILIQTLQYKNKDTEVLEDAIQFIQLRNSANLAFITSKFGCKYLGPIHVQGCRNWWCWWCYSTTNFCQFSRGLPLIAQPIFWQVKSRTIVAPPIFYSFRHPWYINQYIIIQLSAKQTAPLIKTYY